MFAAKRYARGTIFGHKLELFPVNDSRFDLKDILVSDDGSASELLMRHSDILTTVSFEQSKVKGFPNPLISPGDVKPDSRVLILKSGGIGDHIMFLPILKSFVERLGHQSAHIWLSVQKDMFPIFQENPYIDRLIELPTLLSELINADYFVDFSGTIDEAIGPDRHLTDYYLNKVGIESATYEPSSNDIPRDLINDETIIRLFDRLRKANPERSVILLNWFASTHIKSLPPYLFSKLSNTFKQYIFLIVHPNFLTMKTDHEIENLNIRAINISYYMKSIYEYFTAVSLSDAVLCSDTSTYHIAALHQIPTLVLIGPTYSILTKKYPSCTAIEADYQGHSCSAPCGRTKGACPEAERLKTPYSPCLMSISETIVCETFEALIASSRHAPNEMKGKT